MMRYAALVALAGFAAACTSKDCDPAVDTDCDVDSDTCNNSVDRVTPEDGATDAYYRGSVVVKLDDAETGATVSLADAAGTNVPGVSTVADDLITFTPSAPLSPSTTYTVTIDYSCGTPSTTFTTSEVGAEITTGDITGQTYSLDLASGNFVEPAGIGSILGDFIDQEILIGVQTASATNIQMIGAIGNGASPPDQGECDPTIAFPEASFTGNPFFQIGPETTTLAVAGFAVTIEDLEISGAFAPDGSYIDGAVLAGTIDTRPLVPLLNMDDDCSVGAPRCCDTDVDPGCNPDDDVDNCCDEDAICGLAGQIGVSCLPCAGGTGDFCLDLLVNSLNAEAITGVTIDPQHLPADEPTAPPESTNICDIEACSGEAECLATR